MLVNRHGLSAFDVRLVLSGTSERGWALAPKAEVECFQLHHPDIGATNTWEQKDNVRIEKSVLKSAELAAVKMAAGSFRLLRFDLVAE